MKWQNLILLALMMMPIIAADEGIIETYNPNEVFSISIHLTNKTGEVTGANCTAQIRNSTYGVKDTIQLYEINGGYYNATYNTSKVGSYFCRTNCTQSTQYVAGTCDFIIKGDEKTSIAIILMMGIVVAFFFILAGLVKLESIRYLLIAVSAFVLILMVNIGMLIAQDELPISVQNLLSTTYLLILYPLEFILGLGIIFLMLYHVVKWLPDRFKMRKSEK